MVFLGILGIFLTTAYDLSSAISLRTSGKSVAPPSKWATPWQYGDTASLHTSQLLLKRSSSSKVRYKQQLYESFPTEHFYR